MKGELDGESFQAWIDWELEALRYGVDPGVFQEELSALVDGSTVEMNRVEHHEHHADDFVRWGRRGGLATLRRYETMWFSLLAKRRWEKLTAEQFVEAFEVINGGVVMAVRFSLGRVVATPGALEPVLQGSGCPR